MKKNTKKSMFTLLSLVIPMTISTSLSTFISNENIVMANTTVRKSLTTYKDYYADHGYGKVEGHWAEEEIRTLYDMGGIYGLERSDGMYFDPNRAITVVELASLILANAGIEPESDLSWSEGVISAGAKYGMFTYTMFANPKKEITREEMAYMIVTASEKLGIDKPITTSYAGTISDIKDASPQFSIYIDKAYSLGLLKGSDNGFKPLSNTTRAETCAIVNRLFGYTSRIPVPVKYQTYSFDIMNPDYPTEGSTAKTSLLANSSNQVAGLIMPKEGDSFNGGKITRDEETGVLGYGNGQTGNIWLGLKYASGETIKVGDTLKENTYEPNATGKYTTRRGYTYWDGEWAIIKATALKKLREEYPDPEKGLVADIYGNLTTGSMSSQHVFFYSSEVGGWGSNIW